MAIGVVLACGQKISDFVDAVAWTVNCLLRASSYLFVRDILNQ